MVLSLLRLPKFDNINMENLILVCSGHGALVGALAFHIRVFLTMGQDMYSVHMVIQPNFKCKCMVIMCVDKKREIAMSYGLSFLKIGKHIKFPCLQFSPSKARCTAVWSLTSSNLGLKEQDQITNFS